MRDPQTYYFEGYGKVNGQSGLYPFRVTANSVPEAIQEIKMLLHPGESIIGFLHPHGMYDCVWEIARE